MFRCRNSALSGRRVDHIFRQLGSAATVVSRALSFRPVIFIGLISYSLYLYWPPLVFTDVSIERQSWQVRVALVSASVVPAILS